MIHQNNYAGSKQEDYSLEDRLSYHLMTGNQQRNLTYDRISTLMASMPITASTASGNYLSQTVLDVGTAQASNSNVYCSSNQDYNQYKANDALSSVIAQAYSRK